jgi:two-component system chemotaxis response regulator CheY
MTDVQAPTGHSMQDYSTKTTAKRPLRVLYAEDMQELRDLMHIVLGREGYSLETSFNGRLALDRVALNPAAYDLLITDHHMPVMNGLELIREVRRLPFPGKVVVFSSELSHSVRDEYLALKVNRVLEKPIRPATLRQLLREMFPVE